MGPGRDRTRDPWNCSQTRICSQTRYRLRYAVSVQVKMSRQNVINVHNNGSFQTIYYKMSNLAYPTVYHLQLLQVCIKSPKPQVIARK